MAKAMETRYYHNFGFFFHLIFSFVKEGGNNNKAKEKYAISNI